MHVSQTMFGMHRHWRALPGPTGACEAQLESWIATAMGCAPKGTKRDCEPAEKLLDDWASNLSQSQTGTYGEHGNTGGCMPMIRGCEGDTAGYLSASSVLAIVPSQGDNREMHTAMPSQGGIEDPKASSTHSLSLGQSEHTRSSGGASTRYLARPGSSYRGRT